MEDQGVDRAQQLAAIDRTMTGLGGAAARLTPLDKNDHFVSLTEFCWWAISADDALEHNLGKPVYRTARDSDLDGRVAAGLRYVRNALGHHQLTATLLEGGMRLPIVLPITIKPITIRWVPADKLATDWDQPRVRAKYEKNLAGRLVSETTYEARRWLERAHIWARTGDLPN